MAKQTIIMRLEEDAVRRALALLDRRSRGYSSLDEFVEVAIRNQLTIETDDGPPSESRPMAPAPESEPNLLSSPRDDQPNDLAEPLSRSTDTLFVLTNRLAPIKIACRVLARMREHGRVWPSLRDFHERSSAAARRLGVRLREEDTAQSRRGQGRRWIAFPVGDDERAAAGRFVTSFTMSEADGNLSGPMAVLGLGTVIDGRAILTTVGWELAAAQSPLSDGAPGTTLSDEESAILRRQFQQAPGESAAIREFLHLVKRAAGRQSRIDELVAARYPDWTETLAIAHRSAMIGRLADLGLLEASGRGPNAKVQLFPLADDVITERDTQGAA